ncbi:hypothetical protein MKEN_01114200 [Mycena kentingensis (nom. inval.)]|nr:hypothetical protein MKEN_01114200 [Mycena kentingensis (nom. inval.)]
MSGLFPPPGLAPSAPRTPPPSYEILLPTSTCAEEASAQIQAKKDWRPALRRTRSAPAPSAGSGFAFTLPRHAAQFVEKLETVPEEPLPDLIPDDSASDGSSSASSTQPPTPSTPAHFVAIPAPLAPNPTPTPNPNPSLNTRVDTLEINFDQLMRRVDGLRRKLAEVGEDVCGVEGVLVGLESKASCRRGG